MPKNIDAVVFDWGGTLSQWVGDDRLPDFWRRAATHLDPDRIEAMVESLARAEAAVWADVREAQQSGRLSEILRAAAEEHELELAEEWFSRAAGAYLDAWELELHHKPDALPMLSALKSMDLRTGLLSNTHWPREFHERLLERDGLLELLDARVYTSDLTHVKPHPLAFRAVLSELGVKPDRAVFVGDRAYDDIYGAKALGMKTVLVRPSAEAEYRITPDAVVDSLAELVGVIDGWEDGTYA